jgi:hypothetical protein
VVENVDGKREHGEKLKPSYRIWIYGSVSKPCTPGEHQNSW